MISLRPRAVFPAILLLGWNLSLPAATVFDYGSSWKYLLGTAPASSPADAWRAPSFNDGAWSTSTTPLGYGEPEIAVPFPTSSAGGYTTVFLRKSFTIANAANVSQLSLTVRVDDGAIIWLNGTHFSRTNAPDGEVAHDATAVTAPTQWTEHTFVLNANSIPTLASVLQSGTNVLAIHLLNGTPGSSDLYLNTSLSAIEVDPIPPTIANVNPAAGSPLNSLTQIGVTFSEPVVGVDASDLLINGIAATAVTGGGASYTFTFGQPSQGNVAITWAASHGIQDLGVPPNSFNRTAPGSTWSYSLVDIFPPTAANLSPPIGAIVTSLTEVEVIFSEPVSGVNSGDLLINGNPAANLVTSSAAQYTFQFPQPPTGSVSIAWAPGHGIVDQAASPNSFPGGNWSYTLDPNAATARVLITEVMASNTRTLADEDGEFSDWIEIHNPGFAPVNLLGWWLTDTPGRLEWPFPDTNIAAGAYMVIFASDKDRRVPGATLHTSFRLGGSGDYVALIGPDGFTSALDFRTNAQVADVSYGLSQNATNIAFVQTNAAARALVPNSDALGLTWTDPNFADAAWISGPNGVGFETVPGEPGETAYGSLIATDVRTPMHNVNASAFVRLPFQVSDPTKVTGLDLAVRYDDGFVAYLNGAVIASRNAPVSSLVADSLAEFSGNQGQDNWYYGYYNRTLDANGTYQTNDFILFVKDNGPHSASNYWTGSVWDWFAGNPPWTTIEPNGGHPNGSNNGSVHWAVRRWQCEVNGTLRITLRLAKSNASCGNGITGRVFHNGTQVFGQAIAFSDAAGVSTTVTVNNAKIGDLLDFAIDATGTDGADTDSCDGTIYTAAIEFQAPDLAWTSTATVVRPNSLGRELEPIALGSASQWLVAGNNVLAIHGLNATATNADFLVQATLSGRIPLPLGDSSARYFASPTPGAANSAGTLNLGPLITEASHSPSEPLDNEDLFVTARISPSFSPVSSNSLTYRIMFGGEVTVPMLDDGLHGDGSANDGVYGGTIPASAATTNQMIRWFITARDTVGRTTRWPFYTDPLLTPQYLGTVVRDAGLSNPLPVLHWFVQNTSGVNSDAGARCSMYYLGQFYDNIYMNLHGQSSRGFPKRSYDVEFNPGYKFTYRPGTAPVSDVNFMTTYPDKAHLRNILAYDAFQALGNPYHWVEPVRVHQNAAFYGTAHLMENGDDEYVERLGLNPNNPLYKMYNTFTTSPTHANIAASNAEKKTRKYEGNADLLALLNGVLLAGEPRRVFVYDNLDIPQMLNSMATRVITGEQDCCHKNYYFYRDTEGDKEWEIWPWDIDLTWGRRWISGLTYWDDQMIIDTRNPVGDNNGLLQALYTTPEISEMYWRRFRTLMDDFLQAPGTPASELRIERRIDELVPRLAPDALADLAKWGTWCCGAGGPFTQATIPTPTNYQTIYQAADLIKFGYLPARRGYLFTNRVGGVNAAIPGPQPANARVLIANIEVNPSSGNQREEFLSLTNFNNFAVDISGWRIEGAVRHTFKPGTVIPSGRTLYLSPDVNAFRARSVAPRGGQALFVQGNYEGSLSARGETLRLVSPTGRLVDSWNYSSQPSLAQQSLRVTEIMYRPTALAANTNSPEAFEFIEVKNIGASPLPMAGIRFTEGIAFDFTGSSVTTLGAGASVVIVRNLAAFNQRYGATVPASAIAGVFTGALDNNGERVQLVDVKGEEILDFSYNNSWYPLTDGLGFSLVVVNELAQPDAWNQKSQWRPGGTVGGSPALPEALSPIPPILVNEVLSRSETPPPTDSVELHNPTGAEVNIGGWFLTDDFRTPKKFRFPAGTTIPAGGYRVFDESTFNVGGNGFAFGSDGDEVWLFSGDANTNLTGYVHGFDFAASDNGVTFGRHVTSEGKEHLVAQTSPTLTSANSGPRVGPIVITEIMYHPPDYTEYVGLMPPAPADNSVDEYIEIQNTSANAVPLFDASQPVHTWRLTGGTDFTFPDNVTLAPGEFALLVNFSPTNAAALAAFRARFSVNPAIKVFGPYTGELNNNENDVEIKKPVLLAATNLAFVLIDKVDYQDSPPWPAGADGLGYSLQRWNARAFGNDPANWIAAAPSAGLATSTNATPPRFAVDPPSRVVPAGIPATLVPIVEGTSPLHYQWTFNDAAIAGATNLTLTLPIVTLEHDGDYQLLAYNSVGLAVSAKATLSVMIPPIISQAPTNIAVRVLPDTQAAPTTNATFQVSAFSRTALRYQWRFNGADLLNSTNSSITVTNVATNSLGYFTVVVSDGVSSIESAPAWLYPLVRPQILQAPLAQDVPVGASVTLSTLYNGWPPPYSVEWRLGSTPLVTNQENQTVSFFNFTAPNVVGSQQYRVVVRNLALPGGVASAFIRIGTLADSDSDGIPDVWENAYSFNPSNAVDRLLDFDGDGSSNRDEYIAGTDPTNALSYLKVDSLSLSNGTRLIFQAVTNRTYQVLYSDTPEAGAWQKLADIVARPTNRTETIIGPVPGTNRFYRLVTPLQ